MKYVHMVVARKEILGESTHNLDFTPLPSFPSVSHREFGINISKMGILNLDSTDGFQSHSDKTSSQRMNSCIFLGRGLMTLVI